MIPRTGRIGPVVSLALAAAFAGCDGNRAPVVPATTKGEPAATDAGPPAGPSPARGKATPKFIPRSEGKR